MDEETTRSMWRRGSYARVGDWFASASRAAVSELDLTGARVLDVACGTGAVAIEAARRGARVVGLDLTPDLLHEAAARARTAQVDITWVQGSFSDLSAHRDFDVVTSAFGVIFAPDQPAVMGELIRACRPGGTVRIVGWAPGGAFGFAAPGILRLVPRLADGPDRSQWSRADGLRDILHQTLDHDPTARARLQHIQRSTVGLPFRSVDDATWQMRRWSGPWMTLFDHLESQGQADEGHAALTDHLKNYAVEHGDGVRIDVDYTVASLERLEPTAA